MNRRIFFAKVVENWPAKVLSLALAIILFVFHQISTLETRFFFTPLIIENLHDMMPSSPYPRMIRVSLRGDANSVHSILEDDIEAYVDMDNFATTGAYLIPVQWRKKGTAFGEQALQISVEPRDIMLSVDFRISKFVPVNANFRGQVETGFTMTSFNLNPTHVIIDGPAELMGGITELYTELIDLDGRRSDFSKIANILQNDPLMVIRGYGTTEFNGIISQIIPARNITDVPIAITGIREGFRAELETETVVVHLEGDNLNAVNRFILPTDFLSVDCSGITEPGTYVLRLLTGTTENITFRTEPVEIAVRIVQEEDEEF